MKIDKHFKAADSSKSFAIYILCFKINRVKPTITAEILISRKNFRDRFLGWASKQKDEALDKLMEFKEKPKSITDILGIKPYITIPGTVSAIVIDQLDISSSHFKAAIYIEKGHGIINPADFPKALENLRKIHSMKQNAMAKTISENSIIFGETRGFFEDLKGNISLQLTTGPAFQAQKILYDSETSESSYLSPLLKQRAEMERIKRLIQLTSKYSYLFKLPNTLQAHLSRADIDSVIDAYQKHVVIIKTYAHLPVFSKVVKQLDVIISSVKTFILQEIRKNKRITFEAVSKAISNLSILEPRGDAKSDVVQVLYEVIDSYLENMWTRIDRQHELPWLIKESEENSSDIKLKQIAVENIIIRILEKVYVYIEIVCKLATQSQGKKIKRKMMKIANILIKKLNMSFFQDDPDQPIRLVSIDEINLQIKKIVTILQVPSFLTFCEDFTISVVKTKFHILHLDIAELWKDEIWSKDFENKHGTCIPRIFECIIFSAISNLKEKLPCFQENIVGHIAEGVGYCSLALLQAMKAALNSTAAVNDQVSKAQRTLLSLSNTEYLLRKVFPEATATLKGLLSIEIPTQGIDALNVITI